ncbi:DarT ssDNA thymidine ADP-ribosyltransferase family protein [Synechococcus sp. PCC 7336]|uniref:DarT ssDNA thymidine ADP-ribosyltransferase family protein n=1 Tax=Synechococcus sp. PCC 7336 TaxID=195250 RepID=UPI000378D645|nr:DarT ssDNA thymidine ADP-ribosyltransferase family protein [Synechococcus sp. PCC 7336]
MNTILAKYKFDGIWHFTDRSNLALIQEHHGLLSLGEARRRGVAIPVPGGNEWSHDADKLKGVDEYVHLAFVDDHPMLFRAKQEGRIPDPVWLKIKSSILLEEGVRYCSDVSNKSGVPILNAYEAKDQIDFDVLFTYMDWRDPDIQARRQAAIKSEILIPIFIPIEQILGLKNG